MDVNDERLTRNMDMTDRTVRRPRTQAERSDATRQVVIDAALEVLHAQGYSGATIGTIRDTAGVSTGALNHQFPTKALLMAAVVQRFYDERLAAYIQATLSVSNAKEAVESIMDTTESVLRLPEMAAMLEIHLARRNDPDLDRLTKPIYKRFDRHARLGLRLVRRSSGGANQIDFSQFRLLRFAVYRGLAMAVIDRAEDHEISGALRLWRTAALRLVLSDEMASRP